MSVEGPGAFRPDPVDRARAILKERRTIGDYFDPRLFGDACYDILLELFVAQAEGQQVGVSSCHVGAGVPHTTALRWINVLEGRGIVETEADAVDKRRRLVRLSADALSRLQSFLAKPTERF